ncbi:hypothetical protein JXA80_08670 [bacterium]|nr:hypothetical protein [candidate division CSSED10-310 bacterium]
MPREIANILNAYQTWLTTIDAAFQSVKIARPAAIPCHAGCSACCYALFAVPLIDGFLVWRDIHRRPPDIARDLMDRCHRLVVDWVAATAPDPPPINGVGFRIETIGWRVFDAMVDAFQRPCPFLTNAGLCCVYDGRPRICRLAGTVFVDPTSGVRLPDFCPTAEDARNNASFDAAPFPIAAMDGRLMEFQERFAAALESETGRRIRAGHTFPAAGVLEAAAFELPVHRFGEDR